MPETLPSLKVSKRGSVCLVEFGDRKILEELVINQIGERLCELADAEPDPRLLLDFRNVEYLSSAALGMLITLNKQVAGRGGRLVLANIHSQIYEVFNITRLNTVFNIQSSTESALKELA